MSKDLKESLPECVTILRNVLAESHDLNSTPMRALAKIEHRLLDSRRIEKLSEKLKRDGVFAYGNGEPGPNEGRTPDAIRSWIDSL